MARIFSGRPLGHGLQVTAEPSSGSGRFFSDRQAHRSLCDPLDVSFARARWWAGCAVLAVVAGALVVLAAQRLQNTDTYFHLRFGHEFLTGGWSLRDPGSVSTLATAHWVPTQ